MKHSAREGVNIQTSKKLFLLETVYNPQDWCFDSPITILICDKKQTEYTNKSSRMQHLGLVGVSTKPLENSKRFFFFFLISNENFIKKQKTANPSTLGMYYGGINQ